jgi:hypothetical protein
MLLRHDFAAFLQIVADPRPCRHNLSRKSAQYFSISQNRRTFASSKGQLINSINIKINKIMKQQNEMSARALSMEELENVNGGRFGYVNRRIPVRR